MDSLWSREGCCTGRREVEAQCALRSAVSQVHLEINPLPWCKGSSWKTLAAKHATASILYCFLMLFSSPLIAWGWLLWQLKRCHEQQESGWDRVSAGMQEEECELRKQDGLLHAVRNCPIKRHVIQWNLADRADLFLSQNTELQSHSVFCLAQVRGKRFYGFWWGKNIMFHVLLLPHNLVDFTSPLRNKG